MSIPPDKKDSKEAIMPKLGFVDNSIVCYLIIVFMLLLLIVCDGIGKWPLKMRERDRARKMRAGA